MPLENSGKIITKIKTTKTKATLYFGKEKMDVSLETYSSFYLFEGKELSKKELDEIKKIEKIQGCLKLALSIRKRNIISENSLREKLNSKNFEKGIIDNTIKFLKNNNLVDDNMFIEDYLAYAEELGYGKSRVLVELKKKGISESQLKHIKFKESDEISKAEGILPKLEEKYSRYNNEQKKKHVYDALIRYGYDINIASKVIKDVKTGDPYEELEKLRKDFHLYYKKAVYKFDYNDKSIKKYVNNHLLAKGYKNKDITIIWEEFRNENAC